MNAERFSFDTNILFYAIDRDSGPRHQRAQEIIKEAALCQNCILTLQALGEFFAVVTRKGRMSVEEAQDQVQDWLLLFTVTSATPKTFRRAMSAVKLHQLAFWDAMIWAVVREAGATLFLSEDFQHDRVLDGVRFVNPFLVRDPFRA